MKRAAATATPWEDPRYVLARHGLAPKRAWSQNFLVSRAVVDAIVAAVAPAPDERVIELGAGLGTLTAALAHAGARVTAVERDRDLVKVLEQELAARGVQCLAADAATLDYAALRGSDPRRLCVVGNLPYALTGAILRSLVEAREHVERAVLMVQREVRDRLVAHAGTASYGALTVFATAAFAIDTVRQVPRGAFVPVPRVDSSVVRLDARASPLAVETDAFRDVVHAAFQSRRKTLRNALAHVGGAARADAALARAGIDPRRRGETLDVAEFDALARAWDAAATGPLPR